MTISVGYERVNENEHLLAMDSDAFPNMRINTDGIPKDKRGATSVKFLGAACLYCFTATLSSALNTREVDIKSMTGRISLDKDKDEVHRTKIMEMTISVDVEIDDKDEAALEKCKKIMQRGSLLTYSLEESIEIEYIINRI